MLEGIERRRSKVDKSLSTGGLKPVKNVGLFLEQDQTVKM